MSRLRGALSFFSLWLISALLPAAAFFLSAPVAAHAQQPSPPPPSPPSPAPSAYQPPRPLQRPPLAYPELARLNRVSGILRVLLTVDEAGRVADATILSSSGSLMLDQAVRDPVLRTWTFQPAMVGGRPVTGTYSQEFEFKLDPAEMRALDQARAALPTTAGTPDPPYPDAACARALRGRTTLAVTWGDTGLIERLGLQASSGNALLDVTAMRWAYEHWRVDRAQVKDPQFVKTVVFDPDRPARAAALANETPPPLAVTPAPSAVSPASSPTPTPTPRPKR